MTLAVFLLRSVIFNFQESPTFLVSKGRETEAIKVLHHIAAFNKTTEGSLDLADLQALEYHATSLKSSIEVARDEGNEQKGLQEQLGHLWILMDTPKHVWVFVTMIIAYVPFLWSVSGGILEADESRYVSLFFSFSIAGGFLPLILRAKGVDTSLSVAETYRSYLYICLPIFLTIYGYL